MSGQCKWNDFVWPVPRPETEIKEILVEVGADAVEIGDITVAAISLIK